MINKITVFLSILLLFYVVIGINLAKIMSDNELKKPTLVFLMILAIVFPIGGIIIGFLRGEEAFLGQPKTEDCLPVGTIFRVRWSKELNNGCAINGIVFKKAIDSDSEDQYLDVLLETMFALKSGNTYEIINNQHGIKYSEKISDPQD